jgi:hypothetical protein
MDGHGFVWLKINKLGGNCAPNYKANAKMMVFRIPKKPTALLRPKKHHFGVSFAIASKETKAGLFGSIGAHILNNTFALLPLLLSC